MAVKATNKGRVVSVLLHSALLVLFFLPFLSMQAPEEPTKEALVIQFDYPYNEYVAPEKFIVPPMEPGTGGGGSEEGGSTPSEDPIQPRPTESAPSRLAAPSVTSVASPSTGLRSNISDIPLPTPNVRQKQAWQSVNESGTVESDGVEELKMIAWADDGKGKSAGSGTDGDDDSDIWNDGFGSGSGGSGSGSGGGPGNGTGKGSGPGGGTGAGGLGKGSGIGSGLGTGLKWGEAYGEGDLTRSLIQRSPKAGSLAVKEGKICVYLCVDRNGKVLTSNVVPAKSTIKDPALLTKAQETAKEYVFAPDIMAPDKQCGNFYFVFKFN